MRGRPKRLLNADLCLALDRRRVKLGLSLSATAALMGIHPSTLIRALRTNAMSPDMTKAAQQFIKGFADDPVVVSNELRDLLLLLQKINKITPKLQAALEIALDGLREIK